jgi:hypothetical protein
MTGKMKLAQGLIFSARDYFEPGRMQPGASTSNDARLTYNVLIQKI